MIEARELRINNLISHNGLICTVEIINGELDQIDFLGYDDFYYSDKTENLKPIPLTEEWLLKFGFKQNSFSLNFENDTRISIYKKYNCFIAQIDNTVIKEIKYVHEWQNLYFDFTNEELILNN